MVVRCRPPVRKRRCKSADGSLQCCRLSWRPEPSVAYNRDDHTGRSIMPLSEVSATVHSAPAQVPGTAVQPASSSQHDLSFHDILHALNPLHYLPIIGTVYRAATGDVIPEPLRVGGS